MKVMLVNQTKKRVIQELRKILYDHPRYRDDYNNVLNKNSFTERPQRGIIVNGSSADRIRLSADNYMGCLSSFCMLTPYGTKKSFALEWVRENYVELEKISKRRDRFPAEPGVYIIEVESVPDDARNIPGTFTVTPILTVFNEPLITFNSSVGQSSVITRPDVYPGSVRLWLDKRTLLIDGVDYSVDYDTNEVTFLKDTPFGSSVYADYRSYLPKSEPQPFYREQANHTAIPGAVLAFGDRCEKCDKHAIVITDRRTDVSKVYGGKFEVSLELVVFSRDNDDKEKMSDYVVAKILELQNSLAYEGFELIDVAPGSEGEEAYNQESDEFYYEANISASFRVDWEIHSPLPITLIRSSFSSSEAEQEFGTMDGSIPRDLLSPASSTLDPDYIYSMVGKKPTYDRMR